MKTKSFAVCTYLIILFDDEFEFDLIPRSSAAEESGESWTQRRELTTKLQNSNRPKQGAT